MIDNNIHIDKDPELPEFFADARRNHGGQTVPANFFEQFEKKMNAVIDAEELVKNAAPVVKMQPKWYEQKQNIIKIAAASVVILVAGLALQFDYIGHQLQDTQNGSSLAESNEFDFSDPELILPEDAEESYLASTNDYELYEYYCEI